MTNMPNHIKNRLTILGDKSQADSIYEAFGTFYPTEPKTAYDDSLIYKTKDDEIGWWNEEEKIFKRRDREDVDYIPEGYELEYSEEWTRFPDLNKVVPMPDSLNGVFPGDVITAAKAAFMAPVSSHPLVARMEPWSRSEAKQEHEFEGKKLELYNTCMSNLEKYGYAYWYDWAIANWGTKWNSYCCERLSDKSFSWETAWSGVPVLVEQISKKFPDVKMLYEYSDEDTGHNCGFARMKNGIVEIVKHEGGSKEAYDLALKLRPEYKEYYQLVDGKYEPIED